MYACHHCGYDISGLAKPGAVVHCPECGVVQYAEHFEPLPPLTRSYAAWRLTRWAVIWCSVCAVVLVFSIATQLEAFLLLLLVLAPIAFAAGWYGALHESWALAVERQPPGARRRRYWRRALGAGLLLNLLVGSAYLFFAYFIANLVADAVIGI